jgi:hypothetical protein
MGETRATTGPFGIKEERLAGYVTAAARLDR